MIKNQVVSLSGQETGPLPDFLTYQRDGSEHIVQAKIRISLIYSFDGKPDAEIEGIRSGPFPDTMSNVLNI